MTEDRLDVTLVSFYQDTALAPADQEQGVGEVMARVRRTGQRGRWWPLPLPRRTPTATGHGPEQQERMGRGLSDGSAVVPWKTTPVFTTSGLIAAVVLAVAIGSVLLVSRTPPGDPAAVTSPAPAWPVHVTGQLDDAGGITHYTLGVVLSNAMATVSDDRLAGCYHFDRDGGTGEATWGTAAIMLGPGCHWASRPGSDGSYATWEGEWLTPGDLALGSDLPVRTAWLHGRGEHEGLSAVLAISAGTIDAWVFPTPEPPDSSAPPADAELLSSVSSPSTPAADPPVRQAFAHMVGTVMVTGRGGATGGLSFDTLQIAPEDERLGDAYWLLRDLRHHTWGRFLVSGLSWWPPRQGEWEGEWVTSGPWPPAEGEELPEELPLIMARAHGTGGLEGRSAFLRIEGGSVDAWVFPTQMAP